MGRGVPEKQIAAYVEAEAGYNTSRELVNAWLSGRNQPYIGQFIALCTIMKVDPTGILRGELLIVSDASLAGSTRKYFQLVKEGDVSLRETRANAFKSVLKDKANNKKKA